MADLITTAGTSNTEMLKEYWTKKFLTVFEDTFVLKGISQVGICPKKEGTVVHWLRVNRLPVPGAALTEGVDPDSATGDTDEISASLTQQGGTVKLSDIYLDTAIGGTFEATLKRLAYQAKDRIDDVIGAVAYTNNAATEQFVGGAADENSIPQSSTSRLTVTEIRKAVRQLEQFYAPRWPDGFYRGVLQAVTKYDIQGDSTWQDFVKYRDTRKLDIKGEVGEIFGVRFLLSENVPTHDNSGSAAANLYGTLVTSPDYIGISELYDTELIIKNPHPSSDLNLYATAGWKAMFATKVLSVSGAVQIYVAASIND